MPPSSRDSVPAISISAYHGPASFARARIVGVKTDAFAIYVNSDGSKGYYSVFYVLANRPIRRSKSSGQGYGVRRPELDLGNNMPRFVLDRMGIDADEFFSRRVLHGQPRECGAGAGPGHGRRRRQLVERRRQLQPRPAWSTRHAEERGRLADDQTISASSSSRTSSSTRRCLSRRPARRPEGGDRQGLPRRGDEGQGGFDKLSDGKHRRGADSNADYDTTIDMVKFVDSCARSS